MFYILMEVLCELHYYICNALFILDKEWKQNKKGQGWVYFILKV